MDALDLAMVIFLLAVVIITAIGFFISNKNKDDNK